MTLTGKQVDAGVSVHRGPYWVGTVGIADSPVPRGSGNARRQVGRSSPCFHLPRIIGLMITWFNVREFEFWGVRVRQRYRYESSYRFTSRGHVWRDPTRRRVESASGLVGDGGHDRLERGEMPHVKFWAFAPWRR